MDYLKNAVPELITALLILYYTPNEPMKYVTHIVQSLLYDRTSKINVQTMVHIGQLLSISNPVGGSETAGSGCLYTWPPLLSLLF